MTIGAIDLPSLFEEAKTRPFSGAAYVAGGEVTFDGAVWQAAASYFGFGPAASQSGRLTGEDVFRALGFSRVRFADAGSLEQPEPPASLAAGFDTVFDFGESQRSFRLPDAFTHLTRLVAPGGRLIHMAPSANNMDAVWYMLSPTLLSDYYKANGWPVERLELVRYDPARGMAERLAYRPGLLYPVSHGGLDDAVYRVVCVARRAEDSAIGRIPQQSFYEQAWDTGGVAGPKSQRGGPLKRLIRSNRLLYRALYSLAMARTKRRLRASSLKPFAHYPIATWTGGR